MHWVEWINHSNFSFLLGGSHPEDYVQRSADLGYAGLGITDMDGVYGIVRAWRHHRLLPSKGRPTLLYGCEFHLTHDHHHPIVYRDTVVLLALNAKGYQQINQLSTFAHRDGKHNPTLPFNHLLTHASSDVICLKPMRGPIRFQPVEQIIAGYRQLSDAFGSRFRLIVSRHLHPAEDSEIKTTLQIGRKLGVGILFSQDTFFHDEESKALSDTLQAIRLNRTLDEISGVHFRRNGVPQERLGIGGHLFLNRERSLQPIEILHRRYGGLPCFTEVMRQSFDLLSEFDFSLDQLRYQYPTEFLPVGHTATSYLKELSLEGGKRLYPTGLPAHLESILERELQLIQELNFADYFLTVWDIVAWAKARKILCQGRGSAANSVVCFLLGITSVDPQRIDLLFDRFLSRERGDPPDIDVDFEHERREEVIQRIYERFGRHRAAMVANVVTFRGRGARRAVGKALDIPLAMIEESGSFRSEEYSQTVNPSDKLDESPAAHSIGNPPIDLRKIQLWHSIAQRIEGFPRHMGIHACGFIVNQGCLSSVCPVEPATMDGRTVVQWAKDDIEALSIFKIDILALGMLTVIRKCFDLVKDTKGQDLSLESVPHEDRDTYQMIQRADTVGTFQVESRAQMSLLPRLRPRTWYDLVVQIGILRPGPIQGGLIHPFLKRRQGLERIEYPDARLIPILSKTLGVPIFQEQVMRIAIIVGQFSGGEADQLRKQIGAWTTNKSMGPLVTRLEEGMRKSGMKEEFVQQIIGHLRGFASYGFPESHAASFALIAYASCYLKCHHREAFYTSLLISQPVGFYSVHALIQSARREGIQFLPIDANRSGWDSTLEELDSRHWAIRLGLHLVRGLSKARAEQFLEARGRAGPWQRLGDLLQCGILGRADLGALAAANALGCFGLDRASAIWQVEAIPYAPLLDAEEQFRFDPETDLQRIERDFHGFASTLGQHPAFLVREKHWPYPLSVRKVSTASMLAQTTDGTHVHAFGLVLVRQAPPAAHGMEFFTLEDETGMINLAFPPQVIASYRHLAYHQGFLCVSGKLQRSGEGHSILVKTMHLRQDLDPNVVKLSDQTHSPIQKDLFESFPPTRNFH